MSNKRLKGETVIGIINGERKKINIKIDEFVDLLNNYAIYGENGYYIDPLVMTKIIVDKLHLSMSYDNIIEYIKNAKIDVTENQIKQYLDERFEIENPELKQKLANQKYGNKNILEWTKNEIEDKTESFVDELRASKYSFDSYTLEYFIKYIDILKEKSLRLFYLVDKIKEHKIDGWHFDCEQQVEWDEIEEQLIDYDIKINEDGNIYYQDLIRLLTPLIQNVLDLKDMMEKANNLETYLYSSVSKHLLYRDGFTESEIYPKRSLQVKDILFDNIRGYIPLSEEQREKLRKENLDNFSAWLHRIDEATTNRKEIKELVKTNNQ